MTKTEFIEIVSAVAINENLRPYDRMLGFSFSNSRSRDDALDAMQDYVSEQLEGYSNLYGLPKEMESQTYTIFRPNFVTAAVIVTGSELVSELIIEKLDRRYYSIDVKALKYDN